LNVIGDSAYFLKFAYLNLPEKVYRWGGEKLRIFCGQRSADRGKMEIADGVKLGGR
jgi:hypothetical protein